MLFIRTVIREAWRYKVLTVLFFVSILLEVGYAVAAPLSLKFLVDDAFAPRDLSVFLFIIGILFAAGALNIVASTIGDHTIGQLSGRVVRKLRMDLFAHLQRQSAKFYQQYQTGDLVTRFSSDMGSMERVIKSASPAFLRAALNVLFGIGLLFFLEWKLTLAVLVGSVLLFVGPQWLQRRAEADNLNFKEAQGDFSNTVDEMVKGHKTIKALHQQERFGRNAARQIHSVFDLGFKLHRTNSLMERLPVIALLVLNGTMLGFGGFLIFQDQMSIGDFVAFFTLFMSVGQSAMNLSVLIPGLIESQISFRRVGELFAHEPEVAEASSPVALPDQVPELRMTNVTFGYEAGSLQLEHLNLEVKAGSYVALVGASGSGKSTALQLMARFYDPHEGEVSVAGHDLRTVSEASLRKLAAVVSQDTFLFQGTVRENLLLGLDGDPTASEKMVQAAQEARLDEVLKRWPQGFDTPIHQAGGSLSGGERQRMAIARALLRDPKLLLLDEVTSALDPVTEADINALIRRLRADRTIVSVTHRLASVVDADRIYVFANGRIAESGTHRDLLARQGAYAALWEKQNGFRLSGDGLHAEVEADRLAKMPFLHGLERDWLTEVAGSFRTEVYDEGDSVVKEGEEGRTFYLIVRGKFEVWKDLPDGPARVAVLQDGDHFGEIALLRDIPRTATVRAAGPGVVLSIRREIFDRLVSEHPQIRETLEESLAKRTG